MQPLKDLKQIELQLKQSRESLDFALQSGRMGTWDIDLENGSISCSREMLELWGVNSEEFIGQRSILQSKVHPADLDRMNAAIDAAISSESIYELEFRILPFPYQERWVMSRGRCTFSPESNLPVRFAGVVYDITERKAKEEALAAAVKARDQFFIVASHELRTPLTCLQLQTQVMQWDLKHKYPEALFKDKIETGLNKQLEQLQRINRLLDNILDATVVAEGRELVTYGPFNLCEMVSEVLERFKVTADSSDVEIQFTPTNNIHVTWDRYRLEQVLLNLMLNALRYGNNRPIQVETAKDGEHAMIIVRDEGMGIRAEDQQRVFERFENVISQNETSGIGLGLYISNSIVRAHGGYIRLKSEIGKGSEFAVIIPAKPI